MYARVVVNLRSISSHLSGAVRGANEQTVSDVLTALGQHLRAVSAAESIAIVQAIVERAGQTDKRVSALKQVG